MSATGPTAGDEQPQVPPAPSSGTADGPALPPDPGPPAWGHPGTGWGGQDLAEPVPGYRYDVPQDMKNLAMLSTLGMVVAGFLAPLIVYAVTAGDASKRFAHDHAKAGLNFSITWFIGAVVSGILTLVLVGLLGFVLLAIWGVWVIVAGTMQAANGQAPNYPLVPRLLR